MVVLEVHREYQEKTQKVGLFEKDVEGELTFSYCDSYLSDMSAQALSVSLPLRKEPYTKQYYQGFFEGLLPEGRVRTELAYKFHISPSDYLGMLRHLTDESIGALIFIGPQTGEEVFFEEGYSLIDAETLLNLIDFPVKTSADLAEKGRFSLAGAQAKIGVYLDEKTFASEKIDEKKGLETCYIPKGTAPSTHILKVPDGGYGDLPINETFCLLVAQACGLDVAEAFVCLVDQAQVFLSKRYDRKIGVKASLVDGMPRPSRLHQEDFCQALGLPSYRKYEIEPTDNYVAVVARLLERTATNVIEDKKSFAQQVIFDYLIGNCDNHLKNYSILYSSDWSSRRLSPAYDIVCTTVLGYSREMGISIGNNRLIDDISSQDWFLFAQDLGISEKALVSLIIKIINHFEKACDEVRVSESCFKEAPAIKEIVTDASFRLKKLQQVAGSQGFEPR